MSNFRSLFLTGLLLLPTASLAAGAVTGMPSIFNNPLAQSGNHQSQPLASAHAEGVRPYIPGRRMNDDIPRQQSQPVTPPGLTGSAPDRLLSRQSFEQFNNTNNPYNPHGLHNFNMYMPWSTPLLGWVNAENWNWWRQRSGATPAY